MGKTCDLYVENLATTRIDVARNEWCRRYLALDGTVGNGGVDGDDIVTAVEVDERRVSPTFVFEILHVDIGNCQLRRANETLFGGDNRTVLGNKAVARKDEVGGRFAYACRTVDVAAERPCRLLLDKRTNVGMLADNLGCGREVENQFGAAQCHIRRRRCGYPQILANLGTEHVAFDRKEQVAAHAHPLAAQLYDGVADVATRRKPTAFVKFGVVGYVTFRHYAADAVARNDNGTVVQIVLVGYRHADDAYGRDALGKQFAQSLLCSIEQPRLLEQIAAGVARYGEFGKDGNAHSAFGCLAQQQSDSLDVGVAVGNANDGRRSGNLDKSVSFHTVIVCVRS